MQVFRATRSAIVAAAMALGVVLVPVTATAAHGASDYSGAVYQITWSLNCTSRTAVCASDPHIGLGGFWGWAAVNGSQEVNGEETVCGHGNGPGGAFHLAFDSQGFIFHSTQPVGPVVDPNGNYLVLNDPFGLFPVPATPGHYKVSFEGATGEIQVSP